jgi:hypothetical protein
MVAEARRSVHPSGRASMKDFAALERCAEITDDVVADAIASRAAMRALLARASEIARPMEGAARVLVAFARMATTACDWLDGDLRVEIAGDDEVCVVDVMSELGGGMRERVFPSFTLRVSLDEFVRAVRLVPRMVLPLKMQQREGRLVFSATEAVRASTRPPPATEVEEDLLTIEVTAPESAPKLRARAPIPPLPRDEPPSTPRPAPIAKPIAPSIAKPIAPIAPGKPLVPTRVESADEPRAEHGSSRRIPVAAVVEERVDLRSSRRMPIAPVAAPAEERPSAKVAVVPREDDELGAFFDSLEAGAPAAEETASSPKIEASPAPEPPKPAKPASPMLMPKFTPPGQAKRPSQTPKRPSQKPKRPSQKPTVARMSAIRPEELAALRPAKVPAIPYAAKPGMPLEPDPKATVARMSAVDVAPALSATSTSAEPRKQVASTRPKPPSKAPPKRPSRRPVSAPPTARPGAATAIATDDESLDEGWD